MLQKFKITTCAFILCLFGLTLMTVSPVFAADSAAFKQCQQIKHQGKFEPMKQKKNCFKDLAGPRSSAEFGECQKIKPQRKFILMKQKKNCFRDLAQSLQPRAKADTQAADQAADARAEADRLPAQAEVDCVKKKYPNGHITYWDECLHILSEYGPDIAASWESLRVAASERCEKVESSWTDYAKCPDGKRRQVGYDSYMVESFCAGSEHGGLLDSDGWKMHIDDEGHVKGPPAVCPGKASCSKAEIGLARCEQTIGRTKCNC